MPYMSKASMEALLKYVSSKGIPEAEGSQRYAGSKPTFNPHFNSLWSFGV